MTTTLRSFDEHQAELLRAVKRLRELWARSEDDHDPVVFGEAVEAVVAAHDLLEDAREAAGG